MPAKVARDPGAGDTSYLGRNLLDCDHQWKTEYKCPGQAITKLRPDLAVRPDTTWIIVRRACNQTWPEPLDKSAYAAVSCNWRVGRLQWVTSVHDSPYPVEPSQQPGKNRF